MSQPIAVILAAGANSRFFPFNTRIHKSGYTLFGQSLFARTIQGLEEAGIKKVIVIENPRDHQQQSLKKLIEPLALDIEIEEIIQPEPLGMGNALLLAKSQLTEKFIVTFPYLIDSNVSIKKLIDEQGQDGSLLVTTTDEPWLYGILSTEGSKITGIIEKPEPGSEPSNLKAQGTYLLSPTYLEYLEKQPEVEYNFEHALDAFFKDKHVTAVTADIDIPPLKYPWHFFEFQSYLFTRVISMPSPQATISPTAVIDDSKGPVVIEEGAKINDFVKIVGPAYIGKNVLIGDYSFIRESSIEKDAVVGANTEIVRSILFEGVTIHYSYIADSIVGNNTRIAAGFISANRRYDRKIIKAEVKGEKVTTGKDGFGVCMGESVETGIGVKTMPGVCIGAEARVFPGITLFENVPHKATVKPVAKKEYEIITSAERTS